ncbi:MAG: IS110 family transposase [bacterium]|nr:IS110 family transposase [bacterium]
MSEDRDVFGGVDTHRDTHVAAVVDTAGRVLASSPFPADATDYEQLGGWLQSHGNLARVGIQGTGSYGAGLTRHLMSISVEVVEVNRPNRQLRRRYGKTDTTDAEAAARAALSGQASGVPKSGNGPVEAIRMLSVARRSAIKARTQAVNQIHALVVTAPDQVKHHLSGLSPKARVKTCAGFRPGTANTTIRYAKAALRSLARRYQTLTAEIEELTTQINRLCAQANPALLATPGIGPDIAAALLIAAGDNPERMATEASFAALCGVSPVQASLYTCLCFLGSADSGSILRPVGLYKTYRTAMTKRTSPPAIRL